MTEEFSRRVIDSSFLGTKFFNLVGTCFELGRDRLSMVGTSLRKFLDQRKRLTPFSVGVGAEFAVSAAVLAKGAETKRAQATTVE